MGGHVEYGKFRTLDLAVKALERAVKLYVDQQGLFLREARITYDWDDRFFKLLLRFAK